jgi:hypothetical protein
MAHSTRPTPSERSDALACWSAVLLLRSHPAAAVADDGLAPHLAGLLSAVSQELEAGRESVPKTGDETFAMHPRFRRAVRRGPRDRPMIHGSEPTAH